MSLTVLVALVGCGSGGGGAAGDSAAEAVSEAAFSRMTADTTTSGETGAATGTVVDAGGAPLPGTLVVVTATGRQAQQASFSTVCDGDGQYRVGNMTPGRYHFRFEFAGTASGEENLVIEPGQVNQGGPHQLRPGANGPAGVGGGSFGGAELVVDAGSIVGLVQDEAGAPVPGARLSIGARLHAATGPAGAFAFGALPAGVYAVTCRAAGFLAAEQVATVVAGEAAELLFVLAAGDGEASPPADPASLSGVVYDAATEIPLPAVTVQLGVGPPTLATTTTTSAGEFSFPDLRPGSHHLSLVAAGYRPFAEQVLLRPGMSLSIRIRLFPIPEGLETGTLVVEVVDAATGAPIAGAGVLVDGRHRFATGLDGTATVANVPAGTHRVVVGAPGYQRAGGQVDVAAGQTATLRLELTAGAPGGANRPPVGTEVAGP